MIYSKEEKKGEHLPKSLIDGRHINDNCGLEEILCEHIYDL
jgi:hypothetical protein